MCLWHMVMSDVVHGSYADDVGAFGSLGVTSGQDRGFGSASCGVAPGDAGGKPPGACKIATRYKSPRPPPQDRMPAHRTAAGRHPEGHASRSAMHRPRCQETRERNRAGHTRLPQATAEVRPESVAASPETVAPAKAGASGGGYAPHRLHGNCEPRKRRGSRLRKSIRRNLR